MSREHDKRHEFADLHPHTCWRQQNKEGILLGNVWATAQNHQSRKFCLETMWSSKTSCLNVTHSECLTSFETWRGTRIHRSIASDKTSAINCVKSLYRTKTLTENISEDKIHSKAAHAAWRGGGKVKQAMSRSFNVFETKTYFLKKKSSSKTYPQDSSVFPLQSRIPLQLLSVGLFWKCILTSASKYSTITIEDLFCRHTYMMSTSQNWELGKFQDI